MARVLTMGSDVLCGVAAPAPPAPPTLHGGHVQVLSTAKLTVDHEPVLVQSSIAMKAVAACATVPTATVKPCLSVQSVVTTFALKLTTGGFPVALEPLAGKTLPVESTGTLWADAGQNKLNAV